MVGESCVMPDGGIPDGSEPCEVEDETRACPEGGSNVGECAVGEQTCRGGLWSACEGRVEPSAEVCDGLDNDCDGSPDGPVANAACAAVPNSTTRVCSGGTCVVTECATGYDDCNDIYDDGCESELAVDSANCGACGTSCGDDELCDAGCVDAPIHLWSRLIDGRDDQEIVAIARSPDGDLYAVGHFYNELVFDDGTTEPEGSLGTRSGFIAKFDAIGNRDWTDTIGFGEPRALAMDVTTDDLGNPYALFRFDDPVAYFGSTRTPSGPDDLLLVAFSSGGRTRWVRQLSTSNAEWPARLVGTADGVVVAGSFEGSLDSGSGSELTSNGATDGYLIRFDSDGTRAWQRAFGGAGDDSFDAAVQAGGEVCVAGLFTGDASLGGEMFRGSGTPDVWCGCYSVAGLHMRSLAVVNDDPMSILGLAVDEVDFIVHGGLIGDWISDGATVLSTDGPFVARIDATGTHLWSHVLPAFGFNVAAAAASPRFLATTSEGETLISGLFTESFRLGDFTLSFAGGTDMLLASIGRDGTPRWARRFGDAASDAASAIVIDANTFIVGGVVQRTVSLGGDELAPLSEGAFLASYQFR